MNSLTQYPESLKKHLFNHITKDDFQILLNELNSVPNEFIYTCIEELSKYLRINPSDFERTLDQYCACFNLSWKKQDDICFQFDELNLENKISHICTILEKLYFADIYY